MRAPSAIVLRHGRNAAPPRRRFPGQGSSRPDVRVCVVLVLVRLFGRRGSCVGLKQQDQRNQPSPSDQTVGGAFLVLRDFRRQQTRTRNRDRFSIPAAALRRDRRPDDGGAARAADGGRKRRAGGRSGRRPDRAAARHGGSARRRRRAAGPAAARAGDVPGVVGRRTLQGLGGRASADPARGARRRGGIRRHRVEGPGRRSVAAARRPAARRAVVPRLRAACRPIWRASCARCARPEAAS